MFAKLRFLFTHGDELEELLADKAQEAADKIADLTKDNLRLCLNHQQENNHSHHSEHNCDHCIALERIKLLEKVMNA